MSKEECVMVVVRCRPFSEREKQAGHKKVVEFRATERSVSVLNPKADQDIKTFSFDDIFDEASLQVPSCVIVLIFRWMCIIGLLGVLLMQCFRGLTELFLPMVLVEI